MIVDYSNRGVRNTAISLLYRQLGKFCSETKPSIYSSGNILKIEWTVYDAKVVLTNDIVSKKSKISIERIEGEGSTAESGKSSKDIICVKNFFKGLGKNLNLTFSPEVVIQSDRTIIKPSIYKDRDTFVQKLNVFLDLLKAEHSKWKKPDKNYRAMKIAAMKGHLRNGRIKNPEIINKYREEIEKFERGDNEV